MKRPTMLPQAVWHEELAEIHIADANVGQSQYHAEQAEKLQADSDKALANRNPLERLKARPLLLKSKQHALLASAHAGNSNAKDYVTHVLAGAQIRAAAEGQDATLATHKAFHKLLASGNPAVVLAVQNHPTAKILGIA